MKFHDEIGQLIEQFKGQIIGQHSRWGNELFMDMIVSFL